MKRKDYRFVAQGACTKCHHRWPLGVVQCTCGNEVKDRLFVQEVSTLEFMTPVDLMSEEDLVRIMKVHFVKRTNKRRNGPRTTLRMHPMWFWNILYRYPTWDAAKKAAFAA